jgi:dynein heavy chain
MLTYLSKPIEIRDWTINGLPEDPLFFENGIIMFNSGRWPLIIDP